MTEEERQKVNHYLPLHIAAIKGDWESANKFIEQEPDAVRVPVTGLRQTSLVVAIRLARRNEFVKKLIEKMSPEDLALVDSRGRTALHEASITGNVEAAKLLVQRNTILPNILDKKGRVPLYYAANFGFREMVLYLLDVTRSLDVNTEHLEPKPLGVNKENLEPKPFEDRSEEERQKVNHYLPLHIAAIKGDWESANKFIEQEPDAVRVPVTGLRQTSLVVAIRLARRNEFVKKLIEKMSPEDLALVDSRGRTALHEASITGNVEAAKLLVQRNTILPNILDKKGRVPLYYAANFGFREMVLYLLDVTRSLDVNTEHLEPKPLGVNKENLEPKPFEDRSGVTLLYRLATSGLYDIALSVLSRYPKLAYLEPSPLIMISKKPSSFRSGTPLNSWQNLIYSGVPIKLETIADHHSQRDIENPTDCFISSVVDVPQIKHIREKKLLHHQALELVKRLCMEVVKSNILRAPQIFVIPLHQAISFGIREIVEEILKSDPNTINLRTMEDQTVFQYAIMCRSESVFNLIYQLEDYSHALLSSRDMSSNNALHLAGFLGPMQQLKVSAAGPALQVQRELQWFKEVEKFARPRDKERKNILEMTPAEMFTDTHKELVKEGERWMKDTATSCTIVAALIATVVFAAAITVPGGNNNENGHPIFFKQKPFIIFGISDALALFSSIASVLMFLSILTSRYAEEDFLYALPNRLIIGLVSLFVSILSTMIAFGATLYLVFGDNAAWILIPIVALACLPATLFVALQFPLLKEMIKSTYGPGIFGKQGDDLLL
ncbi:hypothetical protein TEA_018979 [Camellia sinensis var. sinensis]|uniref:PGG domain-containing protein n=1 Tax=Camellia sinensis var. sinensis TaxID=542762 RepID=A0A4S4DPH9_CAMSN|nr:hypothetical protein TEA_018979 [Camellia sinensis var. sinensis]